MIDLVLATGEERWDQRGFLKKEGRVWELVYDPHGHERAVLKQEVADWCWDNIGPYRINYHTADDLIGPESGDSWRIEFKTERDAVLFKTFWM